MSKCDTAALTLSASALDPARTGLNATLQLPEGGARHRDEFTAGEL